MKPRIRIMKAAFGADGSPRLWRAVVMVGASVVATTSTMRDPQVALAIAETLVAAHNVAQRAR